MATKVAHTSITLLPALTQSTEELVEHANEVTEVEVLVSHHTLNLVELSKVGGIQGLIAKHPVNGEVFGGSESLLSELVEHAGTDGCCVRAHNVLLSLLQLPVILVTGRGRGGVSGRGGKGRVREGRAGSVGEGREGSEGEEGRAGSVGEGGAGSVGEEGRVGSVGKGGTGSKRRRLSPLVALTPVSRFPLSRAWS